MKCLESGLTRTVPEERYDGSSGPVLACAVLVRLTRWLGGAQLARDDQLSAKDGKHVAALGEMFFNRSTVTTTKQSNRRS